MEQPNSGDDALEIALEDRLTTVESGNYEQDLRHMVGREFIPFLSERGVNRLEEIDVGDCQAWARQLHRRANDDDSSLSAASARTYYAAARAWLGWGVKQGYLADNPALRHRAEGELPTDSGETTRQFWSAETRKEFAAHMTTEVNRTLDGDTDYTVRRIMRDQAIVLLLAYSGLQGGEMFRDYSDDRRNGLRWNAVDLDRERATVRVLGKSHDQESASILPAANSALRRYHDQLSPASDDWPVFPVLDKGTITQTLGDDLRYAGYEGERHPLDVARDAGLTPPAMSLQSARTAVKRHSTAAELPGKESDDEFLKIHGARCDLGEVQYGESADLEGPPPQID